ncbi:MAG TPA: hypothetical protein PK718_04860 [Candidatus Methanofastidiosa archaeon]|nr:hypothetical protein [Candidatus Methanofastidiosa archaeon]HPR41860.1 hypothetical protein [Candidatus Methanofastidiosa archaeon]
MDNWIVLFIMMSVVVFIISFLVPQLLQGGLRGKGASRSPIPKRPLSSDQAIPKGDVAAELDEWEVGTSSPKGMKIDDMSFKGLRIAWKQFNSELDALIKEAVSTAHVEPHQKNRLNELESFYHSTLEGHIDVLSEQDQSTIKDKLVRAKRLIERF